MGFWGFGEAFQDNTVSSEQSSSDSEDDDFYHQHQNRNGHHQNEIEELKEVINEVEGLEESEFPDRSQQPNDDAQSKYTKRVDDRNDSSIMSSQINEDQESIEKPARAEEVKSIYSQIVSMTKSEGRFHEEQRMRIENQSVSQSQYLQANTNVLSPLLRNNKQNTLQKVDEDESSQDKGNNQLQTDKQKRQDLKFRKDDDFETFNTKQINLDILKLKNEPRMSDKVDDKQFFMEKLLLINKKTFEEKRARMMSQQIEDDETIGNKRASLLYDKKISNKIQPDQIIEDKQNLDPNLKNQQKQFQEDAQNPNIQFDHSPLLKGMRNKQLKKRRNSDHSNSIQRKSSLDHSVSDKSAVNRSATQQQRKIKEQVKIQIKQNQELLNNLNQNSSKRKRSQKVKDLVEQHFLKQELEKQKLKTVKVKRNVIKNKISSVQIPPNTLKDEGLNKSPEKALQQQNSLDKNKILNGTLIIASLSSNVTPTFNPSNLNSNSPLPKSITTSGIIGTDSFNKKQTLLNTLSKRDDNQSITNDEMDNHLVLVKDPEYRQNQTLKADHEDSNSQHQLIDVQQIPQIHLNLEKKKTEQQPEVSQSLQTHKQQKTLKSSNNNNLQNNEKTRKSKFANNLRPNQQLQDLKTQDQSSVEEDGLSPPISQEIQNISSYIEIDQDPSIKSPGIGVQYLKQEKQELNQSDYLSYSSNNCSDAEDGTVIKKRKQSDQVQKSRNNSTSDSMRKQIINPHPVTDRIVSQNEALLKEDDNAKLHNTAKSGQQLNYALKFDNSFQSPTAKGHAQSQIQSVTGLSCTQSIQSNQQQRGNLKSGSGIRTAFNAILPNSYKINKILYQDSK